MKNALKFIRKLTLKALEIGIPLYLFASAYFSYACSSTNEVWIRELTTGIIILTLYWFSWSMRRLKEDHVEHFKGLSDRTWNLVESQDRIIKMQEETIKNYREYIDRNLKDVGSEHKS